MPLSIRRYAGLSPHAGDSDHGPAGPASPANYPSERDAASMFRFIYFSCLRALTRPFGMAWHGRQAVWIGQVRPLHFAYHAQASHGIGGWFSGH